VTNTNTVFKIDFQHPTHFSSFAVILALQEKTPLPCSPAFLLTVLLTSVIYFSRRDSLHCSYYTGPPLADPLPITSTAHPFGRPLSGIMHLKYKQMHFHIIHSYPSFMKATSMIKFISQKENQAGYAGSYL
jgi:hypothetical protein